MDDKNKSTELGIQPIDYVASAAKGILGITPFAGSLLVELADILIPNQRMERIARFAEILEKKFATLKQEFIRAQLTNENFSDLLEEGLRQVSRSLTDERREYIANLITNSLSSQDVEYVESKHILRMLSEINDIEIIWLRFYLISTRGGDDKFREKHSKILGTIVVTAGDSVLMYDKRTLRDSYKEHLSRLGLLEPQYQMDSKTHLPAFGKSSLGTTSGLQVQNYQITPLGKFLLKQIGLSEGS
jgi:hypothetical protein